MASMTLADVAEIALLSAAGGNAGSFGAWAERAAWLFVQLARACQLEAVSIPGFWRNGTLPPGSRAEVRADDFLSTPGPLPAMLGNEAA